MLKILHIGNMKSGIDKYVRNTISSIADDFDFVIVCGKDDQHEPVVRHGHQVREYAIPMYRALNPLKDLMALILTIRIILRERPDMIHCHSAKGGFIGRLAGFLTGVRTLYTPHAFSFLSADTKVKRHLYLWLERCARLSSWLLACSESEQTMGMSEVHYKKEKAFVWQNAVPDIAQQVAGDENVTPYICSVGRPSFQKNPLFLLEVINELHRRHPEVKACMVGAGFYSPDLQKLKSGIAAYGLEDVFEILPWLSQEETLCRVKGSLLYLTSARYEGLPLAVIEAMALGKPIVASDVVGNKDCVEDGVNGYLLPMDVNHFVDKICLLLEDVQHRSEMGKASRRLFEQKFKIEERIGYLEEIYRKR
jgi:glycosyltransferase involved in cell wall biosynthesis